MRCVRAWVDGYDEEDSQVVVAEWSERAGVVQTRGALKVRTLIARGCQVVKYYSRPGQRKLGAVTGGSAIELSFCVVVNRGLIAVVLAANQPDAARKRLLF